MMPDFPPYPDEEIFDDACVAVGVAIMEEIADGAVVLVLTKEENGEMIITSYYGGG